MTKRGRIWRGDDGGGQKCDSHSANELAWERGWRARIARYQAQFVDDPDQDPGMGEEEAYADLPADLTPEQVARIEICRQEAIPRK